MNDHEVKMVVMHIRSSMVLLITTPTNGGGGGGGVVSVQYLILVHCTDDYTVEHVEFSVPRSCGHQESPRDNTILFSDFVFLIFHTIIYKAPLSSYDLIESLGVRLALEWQSE